MANKMLIDASHPEETRVVVLRGDRVEEFDFESALRKQLRGNIYLAKVTRVEPSLQAAFVDYGGNRHGFLAFNEIHPDYYQLPKADREALLEFEAAEARDAAKREAEAENLRSGSLDDDDDDDIIEEEDESEEDETEASDDEDDAVKSDKRKSASAKSATQDVSVSSDSDDDSDQESDDDEVESVGSEDALEELPVRNSARRKHYKIQEVIKRRQIILVQVVKEERGNKGAALTTYLSLAGRYTVLMPNTARGGGISRKIANPTDRKRLRKIVAELEVPEGMGLIVRTAGASRTKAELKRDFEYLLRLWENVRDLTLESSAPSLVYEEGNLIKRSIRDLYSKEIEEVLVAGEEEYREAKDFMRMLMPSHAKNVQPYKESEPLFTRYKIESQLNAMYSPYVTLPSGGYIVINQTEALVSIDVNSGRSTKEHSIEETALNTNLEAATEISRQLRLRDLAGLVVIDFIDMEERRNNRAVERRIKECLRHDRARIQVGRISHFGLLEMSRQRLRTGVLEGSTSQCPHCTGTGMIRSTESMALTILRALEDRLITQRNQLDLVCHTNVDVALYILNNKRNYVHDIERRYGVSIAIQASQDLEGVSYTIENMRRDESLSVDAPVVQMDWAHKSVDNELSPPGENNARDENSEDEGKSRRRRRRRGGQSARRERTGENNSDAAVSANSNPAPVADNENENTSATPSDNESTGEAGDEENKRRPRRRGKRGGRRRGNRVARDDNQEETGQSDANQNNDGQNSEGNNSEANNSETRNSNASGEAAPETASVDSPKSSSASDAQSSDNNDNQDEQSSRRSQGRSSNGRSQSRNRNRSDRGDRGNKAESRTSASDEKSSDNESTSSQPPKQGYWNRAKQEASESNITIAKEVTHDKPSSSQTAVKAEAATANSADNSDSSGERRRGWWQKRSG